MIAIGTLYMKGMPIEVGSVYYDRKERKVMLHISCEEMEGDIVYLLSCASERYSLVIKVSTNHYRCFSLLVQIIRP